MIRKLRNLAFVALLGTIAVNGAPVASLEAAGSEECLIWDYHEDCYPDSSSQFEWVSLSACQDTCSFYAGGFERCDTFVWSNPCDAYCYCGTCTPIG